MNPKRQISTYVKHVAPNLYALPPTPPPSLPSPCPSLPEQVHTVASELEVALHSDQGGGFRSFRVLGFRRRQRDISQA